MPERKKIESVALLGFFLQLLFLAVCYGLYFKSHSQAVLALTWFFAPGALLWVIVFLHGRQARLADHEMEDVEDLRRRRLSQELFEEQEIERMPARAGLRVFERYVVPIVSVVLSAGLLLLCYWHIRSALQGGSEVESPLVVLIGLVGITFFGYLTGRYAVGLAHSTACRPLRAAGSFMVGNVATSLLLIFVMAMVYFRLAWLERVAAFFIPGLMGLVGFEVLLNLLLDIYRPRVPGQEARPAYDSRLLGLVAEPGGVLKTLAATLDYQFGFKVSETWFYRFMARAIIPLLLVQLLTLWLLSAIVVVEQGELVFIETFGSPRVRDADVKSGLRASAYGPGYHAKWPWPIEVARKVPADRIFGKEVGRIYEKGSKAAEMRPPENPEIKPMTDPNVILWKELHVAPQEGYEPNFLVPSIVKIEAKAPAINLARLQAHIHYRIKRAEDGRADVSAAYDFQYGHSDVHRLVDDLAYRVVCRIAASQNFLNWVHKERGIVSDRFFAMLQEELDANQTGLELTYASIAEVHPPAETAKAFEDVLNAFEIQEKTIHEGGREAIQMVGDAEGRAAEMVADANIYRNRLHVLAAAEAGRFEKQREAYEKAPDVYKFRKYFSALEEVLEGHRLYIVPRSQNEVLQMDLVEKLRADILKVDLEEGIK